MQKQIYWEMIKKIKKLDVNFSSMIANELTQHEVHNINVEAASMLYNISSKKLVIGELKEKEFYMDTNVHYTLQSLIKQGYVISFYDNHDKRRKFIKLSPKGHELYKIIDSFVEKQAELFFEISISVEEISFYRTLLEKVENFCRVYLNRLCKI